MGPRRRLQEESSEAQQLEAFRNKKVVERGGWDGGR